MNISGAKTAIRIFQYLRLSVRYDLDVFDLSRVEEIVRDAYKLETDSFNLCVGESR